MMPERFRLLKPYAYVILGATLFIALCVGLHVRDACRALALDKAVAHAQELEGERNAAVATAKKEASEKVVFKTRADAQAQDVAQATATIGQLKAVVAKLKARTDTPATPIEAAQDEEIQAQDERSSRQEAETASLRSALGACEKEGEAYQAALKAVDARSRELAKALSLAPKHRPWRAGLVYGRTEDGALQYGLHGSRSFGPLHVGVLALPRFIGIEAGFSF